ncbi:MAG TPA: twin-arginine translocase TatA/TatE family subunit [Pyrinomonadaceae bacterium]|nr:twin-arginine translocase TatA/TatE family subunit [Pyrinomonadaceae bacterium]
MFLFILEGVGTSELMLILIVALVIFGPRKLPQLSRSIGKSLANFKRASEDFKQTWEKEVAREGAIKEALIGEDMLPEDRSILGEPRSRTQAVLESVETEAAASHSGTPTASSSTETVEDSALKAAAMPRVTARARVDSPEVTQTRKRDWL